LNKINLHDLEGSYDKNVIDDVEHNVDFYYEAADYIEKYLLGKQYYGALLHGVNSLIKKMAPSQAEYDNYAKSEYDLSKKFTNMMLHPNNINQFKNQIKRMSLGTMSLNEFRKIYSTNKGRMPKLSNPNKFKSFKEYKDEKHETQN
jgi:hypothetical protein